MGKLYDVSVKTGSYLKDGQVKNKYETVGAIMESKNGGKFMLLKASFNPAAIQRKEGDDNILLSLYPPKERIGNGQNYTGPREDFDFKHGPEASWNVDADRNVKPSWNTDSGVPF